MGSTSRDGIKKVHFASRPQTLYYLSYRPASATRQPLYELYLKANNCNEILTKSAWLSDPSALRREPYCQLDYLQVESKGRKTINHKAKCDAHGIMFSVEGFDETNDSDLDDNDGSTMNEFNLVGEVAVHNLAYHKQVLIHYTLDGWKTRQIQTTRYISSVAVLRIDKFRFRLVLGSIQCQNGGHLELAIEYQVTGRTFWNNNGGKNFQFNLQLQPLVPSEDEIDCLEDEFAKTQENDHLDSYTFTHSLDLHSPPQAIPIPSKPNNISRSLPSLLDLDTSSSTWSRSSLLGLSATPLSSSSSSLSSSSLTSSASTSTFPSFSKPLQCSSNSKSMSSSPLLLSSTAPIRPLPSSWDNCTKSFTLMAMASAATSQQILSPHPLSDPFLA